MELAGLLRSVPLVLVLLRLLLALLAGHLLVVRVAGTKRQRPPEVVRNGAEAQLPFAPLPAGALLLFLLLLAPAPVPVAVQQLQLLDGALDLVAIVGRRGLAITGLMR